MFCAYSHEGGTTADVAAAPVVVTFLANGPGGGSAGGGGGHGAVKPANTAKPRVIRSGGQLRCTRGRWGHSPTTFGYRWLVLGKANAAATGAKLAITRRLGGHNVQCVVRASNAAGSASARSAPLTVR